MKNPFNNLIFMFFIIVFLLVVVYISSFAYEKKYYPIRLSNFQYSTAKSSKNLPEGIDGITYASNLDQCPAGQCVLDIETGLKRCPENMTSKLVYNRQEETCTRLNFCDYEGAPYAVNSDGSATTNICETSPDGNKIPCRCTDKRTCSDYQLSKFIIQGGDPDKTTSQNFQITQETGADQGQIGYFPITIQDSRSEFCEINPGFTNILLHGCDFQNSIQDKLDCQNINSIVLDSTETPLLLWELSKDIEPGDDSSIFQTSVDNTKDISLEESGLLKFTGPARSDSDPTPESETIKYFSKSPITTQGNTKFVTISGITSISTTNFQSFSPSSVPGKKGFQKKWYSISTPNLTPKILSVDAVTETCTVSNQEVNYKNMLLCTQTDNNVCKIGNFSYNFDKLNGVKDSSINVSDETFTRNFCQLNINNDINVVKQNYLDDPAFYTLSCAIGSGCNGLNLGENPNDEAAGKYFPDVDVNGINGIWEFSNIKTFPSFPTTENANLLNNETIQPGDFWSMKFINQDLLSVDKTFPANTEKIEVTNLFGLGIYTNDAIPNNQKLAPGVCIGTDGYRLTAANYDLVDGKNVSSICITPGLCQSLGKYSTIRINPPDLTSDSTYGIISKENGVFKFKKSTGEDITNEFEGLNVDLVIYKQYSFSGPNYVTKLFNGNENGNFKAYTKGDGTCYVFSQKDAVTSKEIPTPLKPPRDIYNLSYASGTILTDLDISFYSPQAPFKIPMSMYYPVWNPVLFQQECVRCKPLLLSTPELNSDNVISNVIVQYSAKDFQNYQYNAKNDSYCYVTTSIIDYNNTELSNITSQRIILTEPNENINVGDYVLDSTLQMPLEIVPFGDLEKTEDYYSFFVLPQLFPSKTAVNNFSKNCLEIPGKIDSNGYFNWPNPVTEDPINIRYGLEESTSENLTFTNEGKTTDLFCNQKGTIAWDSSRNRWQFYNRGPNVASEFPNNYFFGKKYQSTREYKQKMGDGSGNVYTQGFYFVPLQKVIEISDDRKTIVTDSPFPIPINQRENQPTYVQFCRLDSPLNLLVTNTGGTPFSDVKVKINSVTDSRITNIKVTESKRNFLRENLPIIKIDTKNQNFL